MLALLGPTFTIQKRRVIPPLEASLDDTKRVVRAKLSLKPGVDVKLAQLRGTSKIVLDDGSFFVLVR